MFGDYSQDLLRSGIIELKAGNLGSARRYLDRCVYMSGDHDIMAEAWYWLSQTTDDPAQQRQALENCLANDLHHARARRALAVLDGRLKPDEIIDPNALMPPGSLQDERARRFTCARCGGRMVFAPDGRFLLCEYCRRHQRVNSDTLAASGNDFVLAMATRRGHSQPLLEQVRRCQACGAEFIRPAAELSFNCPYCDSPQVLVVDSSGDLLAPDGILLHGFDERHAREQLKNWMHAHDVKVAPSGLRPRGLYLPIWTFTLGGGIDYTGERTSDVNDSLRRRAAATEQIHDRYPVMLKLSVAASRRPSAPFVQLIPGFNLETLEPYDARYLAAWPAELYDVSMAEASLEARSQAYAGLQRELPDKLAPIRVISTSSANLVVESFQLHLLPVWICEIRLDGRGSMLLINGQTGAVAGQSLKQHPRVKRGPLQWLGDLVAE